MNPFTQEAPIAEVARCVVAALAPVHKCALGSTVKYEVPSTCDAQLTSLHLCSFPSTFTSPHVHDKLRTESGHRHLFSSIARYRTLLGDIADESGTSPLPLHFIIRTSLSRQNSLTPLPPLSLRVSFCLLRLFTFPPSPLSLSNSATKVATTSTTSPAPAMDSPPAQLLSRAVA